MLIYHCEISETPRSRGGLKVSRERTNHKGSGIRWDLVPNSKPRWLEYDEVPLGGWGGGFLLTQNSLVRRVTKCEGKIRKFFRHVNSLKTY